MKKFISILALLFTMTVTLNAMSYEQARQQALFLTDKMAYELNLTNDQYEAAYEINLDYLIGVNTYDDLYGPYWRYRNVDLSYVLLDWQYRAYCAASYFYRPLYFSDGLWHFSIYARYPHRDYFYFDRPVVYVSYCGGHSWHRNGGRSWYNGRRYAERRGDAHFGMRDGFNRGDYGRGNRQSFGSRNQTQQRFGNNTNINNNGQRGSFGSRTNRESSTRTTVTTAATLLSVAEAASRWLLLRTPYKARRALRSAAVAPTTAHVRSATVAALTAAQARSAAAAHVRSATAVALTAAR